MATIEKIKALLAEHKPYLKEKYPIESIGIFGSYTRNEQNPSSDVDIIVEFTRSPGIEFIDLAEELEALLGHKVDLISRKGIKEKYWKAIHDTIAYV